MTRNAALSEAVDALTAARRSRCLLDALPRSARPADRAEAYAIQNEVARRIGPVTAWKVGASGPDAEPSCAPINADTLFFDVERLPADMFNVIGIEAEIVYRLRRDLPAREAPWTREEVLDAIASIHPGFEICDTRFVAYRSQDPLSHLADQANHGALIVGPAAADWRAVEPVRQPLTLDIDGERRVDAVGGNAAGDPVRLLAWLANVGAEPFGGLHAGDTVTTGSCTGTILVHPHSRCKWPFRRACAFGCCMEGFDLAANFTEASGRGTYLHRECGRTTIFIKPGSRAVATFPGLGSIALTVS